MRKALRGQHLHNTWLRVLGYGQNAAEIDVLGENNKAVVTTISKNFSV